MLLLLGLMSAPVLGAYCEAACAHAAAPLAAVPSCHDAPSDGAGPAVRTTEDCGDHAIAPAVLSGLRAGRILLSLWTAVRPPISGLSGAHPGAGRITAADPPDTPPRPIPPGTAILRI